MLLCMILFLLCQLLVYVILLYFVIHSTSPHLSCLSFYLLSLYIIYLAYYHSLFLFLLFTHSVVHLELYRSYCNTLQGSPIHLHIRPSHRLTCAEANPCSNSLMHTHPLSIYAFPMHACTTTSYSLTSGHSNMEGTAFRKIRYIVHCTLLLGTPAVSWTLTHKKEYRSS